MSSCESKWTFDVSVPCSDKLSCGKLMFSSTSSWIMWGVCEKIFESFSCSHYLLSLIELIENEYKQS